MRCGRVRAMMAASAPPRRRERFGVHDRAREPCAQRKLIGWLLALRSCARGRSVSMRAQRSFAWPCCVRPWPLADELAWPTPSAPPSSARHSPVSSRLCQDAPAWWRVPALASSTICVRRFSCWRMPRNDGVHPSYCRALLPACAEPLGVSCVWPLGHPFVGPMPVPLTLTVSGK